MIKYRPHHFVCTLGFSGKGYSPKFVKNMTEIVGLLRSVIGDSIKLKVVEESDSICLPCPLRRGLLCEKQSKIKKLDDGYLKVLGLKAGDELTWREVKQLMAEKISYDDFHNICSICEWHSLGLCEEGLRKLKSSLIITK